ncbi:unnamed protein product [Mytilus coruscus]|uniref:Uncharacterized protein n=1 Tax=Mytilus coruscus TaxID=42192 RepID=A0A6J8E031_MYTCO|nr:unnamed protein product [Mytilus coruscus]
MLFDFICDMFNESLYWCTDVFISTKILTMLPYWLTDIVQNHKGSGSVRNLNGSKPHFYLAAVNLVRIYENDKAKWTKEELRQWINYMLYAGVERIYLYDHFKVKNESLRHWSFENFPYVVGYHDWHDHFPYSVKETQMTAYQHAVVTYGNISTWQIQFDMDEYPFMPNDKKREFLIRFLHRNSQNHPDVNEWSVKNFLFLGKPKNERHILKRYLRRTPKPANTVDKPICRTKSMDADVNEIRMNHYWGARLQNWGNDTPKIFNITMFDDSIVDIANQLELYVT